MSTIVSTAGIHTRALLVNLTLRMWSGHKFDRDTTNEVNRMKHTSNDAGRYNKHLLKNFRELKELQSLITGIRQQHYAETLAWSDEGWRLLTTANYSRYADKVRGWTNNIDQAVHTVKARWNDAIDDDRSRLNGMFDRSDYPQRDDIGGKFGISVGYVPLPIDDDVRVNLGTDAVDDIKASVRQHFEQAIHTAVSDAWQRLYDDVSRVAERLADPTNVFRDSLIGNIRSTVDTLKRLNVTDDPDFETIRARVERELCKYDPDVLRDFRGYRQSTADKAAAILRAMQDSGMIAR